MLNKFRTFLVVFWIITITLTGIVAVPISIANGTTYTVSAQADTECPPDSVNPNCEPPRIKGLEELFVRLIYMFYFAGGVIFLFYLMWIGWVYMRAAGSPELEAEAKDRIGKWIIGIILFYFSRTLVATFMNDLVSENGVCYADLNDPGFTIFFPDVCTRGDPMICNTDHVTTYEFDKVCAERCVGQGQGQLANEAHATINGYTVYAICYCSGEADGYGSYCLDSEEP
jgi:hypothetical protein